MLFTVFPINDSVGFLIAAFGIVLSVIGRRHAQRNHLLPHRRLALAGIILGVVGLLWPVILVFVVIALGGV